MKFTLSWLKDHLETEAPAEEIAERLTALGLEVERMVNRADALEPFTVAAVVEARAHPNADKLSVCIVDTGRGEVQVVCGAPNARTGMKGVFARAGTTVPGTGLKLKKSVIRGVESNGMLCSEREMGLSDDHESIIELPEDAPVGEAFAKVAGLDDPLFDLAITPNRADCLGVRGIARDLAAAGLGKLRAIDTSPVEGGFESPLRVELDFAPQEGAACPCFVGRTIRGVTNGPSPRWLQQRLEAIGLRPISALVDITNYVTFDLARPAHVFDMGRIRGDLWVRLGCGGAKLAALDGKPYELDDAMTAIGDETGVLSLAGVIGGESSSCTEGTTDIFLEIATFDPVRTAATGRKLGIETDARYRFERGVDPAALITGAEIATRMILECCGGEASRLVVAGAEPDWRRRISFRPSKIASLGGLDLDPGASRHILTALGFGVEGEGESLEVSPPSWRADVEAEADLVEEVLRVHGYDAVPAVSLARPEEASACVLTPSLRRAGWVRRALAARGMVEAITWSFTGGSDAALFGDVPESLHIANPISAELDVMRPCVLPNLLRAVGRNMDRGIENLALFEVGPQFADDTPEGESRMASGVRRGSTGPRHWAAEARALDAFDAKADAVAALEACGLRAEALQTKREAPGWYHPGRSGVLALGPNALGFFGELHPGVLHEMALEGPLVGFEVFLDRLPERKARKGRARAPLKVSGYPAVERDFAFVVDDAITAAAVIGAAKSAERQLITEVMPFDLYQGEGIAAGKKSLAIAVRLEPMDRTLTEAEIEAVAKKIVAAVVKATGGSLRD
jgi:phenylalanyl-tRNA synthetase beta chain